MSDPITPLLQALEEIVRLRAALEDSEIEVRNLHNTGASHRVAEVREALRLAIRHIEHMAAWITAQNPFVGLLTCGSIYSFESLGEDMPRLRVIAEQKP